MFLGSPDIDLWWLGFVGWVPWLWAVDGQSPKRAFLYGWVAGTVAVFGGFFWLGDLLGRFGGFPPAVAIPIQLLFSAVQGLQWAWPALLLAYIDQRSAPRKPRRWLVPLSWALVEWCWPNVFPTYMSLMWCWHPEWIQHADLGGSWLVSATMVAINAALYDLIISFRPRKAESKPKARSWPQDPRVRAAVVLLAWLWGLRGYGALRIAQIYDQAKKSPSLSVGVVQGNFGILTYSHSLNRGPILQSLQRESAKLQSQGAEVILWGESAYPFARALHRDSKQDLPGYDPRKIQSEGLSVPIIVGLVTFDLMHEDPYPWNTAWVLEKDGSLGDRYDKNYPLMFGEWVPLVDPEWYLEMVPSASYIHRGEGPGLLEVAGFRMGPLICYEDLLPDFVAETTAQDVHVLVNLTNDSWFGKTKEQSQHLGLALYRAIETRRPLLRSVNAGISAYVDPTGKVVHQLPVTDSDTEPYEGPQGFVAKVPMMDPEERTIFVWIQNHVPWLFLGINLLGLWIAAGKPKSLAWIRRPKPESA